MLIKLSPAPSDYSQSCMWLLRYKPLIPGSKWFVILIVPKLSILKYIIQNRQYNEQLLRTNIHKIYTRLTTSGFFLMFFFCTRNPRDAQKCVV